ncbi:unnamed protein product [Victoria cruziana]
MQVPELEGSRIRRWLAAT